MNTLPVLNILSHNLSNDVAVFAQELNSKAGPSFGAPFPSINSIPNIVPDEEQKIAWHSLPIVWGFVRTCIYPGQVHFAVHAGMLSSKHGIQLAMKVVVM